MLLFIFIIIYINNFVLQGLAGPASTSSSHDEDSLPPSLPLATEDYLDEPVSSPASARRARKRRTLASMPTPQVRVITIRILNLYGL